MAFVIFIASILLSKLVYYLITKQFTKRTKSKLDDIVIEAMPSKSDPLCDIVFIVRAGALFPMYRTSSLLEQIRGRVIAPSVLFFPGELDGAAGLQFMGVFDAEHNYRPQIF